VVPQQASAATNPVAGIVVKSAAGASDSVFKIFRPTSVVPEDTIDAP
jgi:hypothetical protein